MPETKMTHLDKVEEAVSQSKAVKHFEWHNGDLIVTFHGGQGSTEELIDELWQLGVEVESVMFHDNSIRFNQRK